METLFSLNIPHVRYKIFDLLDPPDLDCCLQVCRVWNETLKQEIYGKNGKIQHRREEFIAKLWTVGNVRLNRVQRNKDEDGNRQMFWTSESGTVYAWRDAEREMDGKTRLGTKMALLNLGVL